MNWCELSSVKRDVLGRVRTEDGGMPQRINQVINLRNKDGKMRDFGRPQLCQFSVLWWSFKIYFSTWSLNGPKSATTLLTSQGIGGLQTFNLNLKPVQNRTTWLSRLLLVYLTLAPWDWQSHPGSEAQRRAKPFMASLHRQLERALNNLFPSQTVVC